MAKKAKTSTEMQFLAQYIERPYYIGSKALLELSKNVFQFCKINSFEPYQHIWRPGPYSKNGIISFCLYLIRDWS